MLIGHSLATGTGCLLAIDPQFCEIVHREERELIGTSFEALTHPADRAQNIALLGRLSTQDGPLVIRKRYVRPDGSAVWSSVEVSRMQTKDGQRLVGTVKLLGAEKPEQHPEDLWRSACQLLANIQERRLEFGDDMFSDYGWLVLLEVYIGEMEGRMTNTLSIVERACVPLSLAHRWIGALRHKGLLDESPGGGEATQLTTIGLSKVENILARLAVDAKAQS